MQFADEIRDPRIRRLLAASTAAEVGGQGSRAEQCYVESVFNRAAARYMCLEETLRNRQYYSTSTLNKLDRTVSSVVQARIDKIIDGVMAGSNQSYFATGNESGAVVSGGAPVTYDLGPGKERFIREIPDLLWVRKMEAAVAGGDVG
jgi:hypothetical protein